MAGGLGVIAVAGWFLHRVFVIGDTAERQTLSMDYLGFAVVEYLDAKGNWPGSWEELAAVRPSFQLVSIPGDVEWVEQRVDIDFHANVHEIARQTPQTFTGFKPRGKAFYDYTTLYKAVIEASKRVETRPATQAVTGKN